MKLDLGGNIWLVALYDHELLEMVKIKISGKETFEWLATKLAEEPDKRCTVQKTFTAACFKGEDKDKDKYKVHLKASEEEEDDEEKEAKEEKKEKKRRKRKRRRRRTRRMKTRMMKRKRRTKRRTK